MTEPSGVGRVAVIAGASGLTGSACLERVLASGEYRKVIALVRRPLAKESEKLQQVTVNFDELPPLEVRGGDIFSALGTTMKQAGSREEFYRVDHDYTMAVARSAAEAGARQFVVVSSVDANPESHTFYLKVKGEVEEELKQLGFASLHIFRPSFLAGDRIESRAGERLGTAVAKALEFAFIGRLRKYSAMDIEVLAKAMVNAARLAERGTHVYEYEQIVELANR